MRRILVSVAVILLCDLSLHAQPTIVAKFVARSHTYQGTSLLYRLFIPQNYSPSQRYPVVLALHGSGERGSDNLIQLTSWRLATSWADPVNQARYPCFVVAPQCPSNESWSFGSTVAGPLTVANNILDSLAREFSIDTCRMYVTGLSMGGFGTWDLIVRFPQRFAAAVPMSGGADVGTASAIIDMPIWNFHGAVDNVVPVELSRTIIEALHALGRRVVYTHCRNADCAGLPDSLIEMNVKSHADLFYTEYRTGGHVIWDESYDYPFLFPWVFDKYRRVPGAIQLTNLTSHETLSGTRAVTWTGGASSDSVELWFSRDAGETWTLLERSVPNNGAFSWNTGTVNDCAFGMLAAYLRNERGYIYGVSRSSLFTVNNAMNGAPFVSIRDDEFTTGAFFVMDSLDLHLLMGDPESASLGAAVLFSVDGGTTFSQCDAYTAMSDTVEQAHRVGIGALPNSDRAVLQVRVTDGSNAATAMTPSFVKRTPRTPGPVVDHTAGSGGLSVTIHVVDAAALTGHRYRITIDDTAAAGKSYDVADVTAGTTVVRGARQLDGTSEGPSFDGIRLVVADVLEARLNPDSTRWNKGGATMHVNVFVAERLDGSTLVRGMPDPYDYRITLRDVVVDTSVAMFGLGATPMKFSVWNRTANRRSLVLFDDADGNNAISSFDEIDILEPDSIGQPRLSWGMFFVTQAGDIPPQPGDEFSLGTIKPLTSGDVFEFTANLTAVREQFTPTHATLDPCYPNPFNPATVVRYSLPSPTHVVIKVFDITGREVATLVDGDLGAGVHLAVFEARSEATGVYVVRMQSQGFVSTQKMMLLR